MNSTIATRELLEQLGGSQVTTEQGSLYKVSMDNLRYSRMPSACIRPVDEDAVGTVLRLANKHGIPVTARGAGSATTGATTPVANGWVLDLSNWKNLHIDPVARMAYAQPGVTLGDLDDAANALGLCYPPDPDQRHMQRSAVQSPPMPVACAAQNMESLAITCFRWRDSCQQVSLFAGPVT